MKNRVIFVILAISLLLAPQTVLAEEDDIVSISFSNELDIGDSYSWQINNSSSALNIAPHDVVNIDIIGDNSVSIFDGDDFLSDLNTLFNISVNNDHYDLEWYDFVFWFICPTDAEYTNGTHVNLADNLWVALVYDDFYFNDIPYSVFTIDDLVSYSGTLEYEDGSLGSFDGVVNRNTGLVQSLAISFIDADGVVDEFIDLKLLNPDEELTLAFLPLNTFPFAFSITILATIIRKRKIKT